MPPETDNRISPHFTWAEARCKDGADVPLEYRENARRLAEVLEAIRGEAGGRPVRIVSWYRSPAYNRRIGGARASQHMTASAADIRIDGMTPAEVHAIVDAMMRRGEIPSGGLGRYRTFTHVDIRGRMARWSGSGIKDDKVA